MAKTSDQLRALLEQTSRIAVIGMKPMGAAGSVPRYMKRHGYEIVPVNPHFDEIDGDPVVDTVDEIDAAIDMVNIFRRSEAVVDHVDEILAMHPPPQSVWMQLGIRNAEATRRLEKEGIHVVQDRCLKVEHARLL